MDGKALYIGYARGSAHEQNLALQQDALTQAGLRAARVQGRVGGHPKVFAPSKRQRAVQLYQAKQLTVKEICEIMGISKPTLYAYVRQAQASSLSNDTEF